MPTVDSLIGELVSETFELDCPRMTLRRGDGARTLRGSGFIRVKNGVLRFQMISTSPGTWGDGIAIEFARPGKGGLIPRDQLYDLTAVDNAGDRWFATGISPDCNCGKRLVIRGNVRVLERNKPRSSRARKGWITVDIFDSLNFPANVLTSTVVETNGRPITTSSERSAAEFPACGCHFRISRTEHGTRLSVEAKSLPTAVAERSLEALSFLLGRPVNWNVISDQMGLGPHLRIQSRSPAPPPRNLFRPPLRFAVTDPTGGFWRIFEAYLARTIADDRDDWHPLTKWVASVMEPGMSAYGFALALPVAIEGVLHSEFKDYGKPPSAEQVDELISHLNVLADHPLRARAEGSLNGLRYSRAGDKLIQLAREGIIPSDHVKRWQNLRNRGAHGTPHDDAQLGTLMELCRTANMVFSRIVLKAIGYAGKITDWDTAGCPIVDFPATPPIADGARPSDPNTVRPAGAPGLQVDDAQR